MYKAGFVGVGNMGEALLRGLLKTEDAGTVAICDPDAGKTARLGAELGCVVLDEAAAIAAQCQLVVVAVKPAQVLPLLTSLQQHVSDGTVILSVAAGITTAAMEEAVGGRASVVRAMPNTPCLVGRGASGWTAGARATAASGPLAARVLAAVGLAVEVPETQMDAVTALSGSGPAYVFRFIEGLIEGGVALGLDENLAKTLAIETVVGAAALAVASADPPSVLRQKVTSPGGTTAAALRTFDAAGLVGIIGDAMVSARDRAAAMSREYCPGAES